jgi:hypothetical protein
MPTVNIGFGYMIQNKIKKILKNPFILINLIEKKGLNPLSYNNYLMKWGVKKNDYY